MVNPKDYTVGWICAIPAEFAAARAFLDVEHKGPDYVLPQSVGHYALGKVGDHNVVIATLPAGEYGTSIAATVARDMVNNFPNVKIGLMVGVGGGVPTKQTIRLGDVVVSTPGGGSGGIFQYDFGKTIQNKSFQQTGFHNQPPLVLLTACNGLRARYASHGHQLQQAIDTALNKTPKLKEEYQRPDPSTDRLYQATVVHPNREVDCAVACGDDPSKMEPRPKRTDKDDDPAIHYGLIASGNQLMKDASIRDKLALEKNVLCFEMEAAGLLNHFPCIIIRGICDYSDSHKNKIWQGYAAMTAAAYAKDLLSQITPTKVEAEMKIAVILDSVGQNVKYLESEHKQSKIGRWLSPSDPLTNYREAIRQRHEDTGTWFLNGGAFTKWKTQRNSFLWLHGGSGCGKTVLSSTIIENLENTFPTEPVIYFYFDFKDTSKRTLDDMIRSLISQLCGRNNSNPSWRKLYSFYSQHSARDGKCRPASPESLSEFLLEIIEQNKEIWVIIDALDECSSTSREKLLSWMSELRNPQKRNVHLLVTSRTEADIENGIKKFADESNVIPIEGSVVTDDIRAYIDNRLVQDRGFQKWRGQQDVRDELKARLMKNAGGMFRLVACQLDSLADCVDYDELMNTLNSLPNTLTNTYKLVIRSIPSIRKEKAIRILQFLTFSDRALRIHEAVDALAISLGTSPRFDSRSRMPDPQDIKTLCLSLVVIAPTKDISHSNDHKNLEVQIAHSSVKEYLTSNKVDEDISQCFKEATARASIARVCLAYLSHLDPKLSTKETRKSFPLAEYCARYWMSHAAAAEDSDEKLQGLINDFFCSESFTACYNLYRPDLPWETTPDMREDGPAPPLYYAALGGFSHAVENLLSRGDDINAQGGYYGNALQAASYQGHEKVVELLLNKGVDVNAQVGRYGTALYAASIQGHEKVVELLLSSGADVGAQGGYGTALYVASLEGHGGVIELLLNKGADVNTQSEKYGTPLYAASYSGDKKLVEALLSNGADVNAQGGSYGTALQAASYGGYKEVVKVLLSEGADVSAQSGTFGTALQAASYGGHKEVVEVLLSKGADVNAQGGLCTTALKAASYKGHEKLVDMLLSKGADIKAQDAIFGTALHAASHSGQKKLVEMLLSKGADANTRGGKFGTAVYAASVNGHKEVVELLLSRMDTQFSRKWHEADSNRRLELSGLPPITGREQPSLQLVDGLPPTHSDSKGDLPPTLSDSTCSDPKEGLPPTRGDSKESSSQTRSRPKGFFNFQKKKAKLGEILNINSDKGEKTSNNGQGNESSSIPRDGASAAPMPSVQSPVDTIVVDPVVDYALDTVDDVLCLVPPIDDDLYSDRAVDDPQYFYREDISPTSDPDVDDVLHLSDPGVNEILLSDIGISKLCDRLKQSIVSAKEFANFCLGRSKIETERRKSLERICKSTGDEVRRPEGRQNSYVKGIQDIIKVFEQMADHGHKFSLKLTQIHINLSKLAENTERKRKDIRQLGLAEEKRVQDAERQGEKAKEKYYRLAQDLYHQKRNPKASSNLHFTLSGPKSTGQFEGDLNNKVELADSEYRAKVAVANDMRQNLVLTLRPNAVKSLLSSISEIDTALKRSMEELAAEQELLISRDQMTVVPTNENPDLRITVAQIDNVMDFRDHILSFSSEVPKIMEIKYERHPTLSF